MNTGKLLWFNDRKGYGFIIDDDSNDEVFVHYSQIMGDGFKVLAEDQKVVYDKYESDKGFVAKNVRKK